jgi:hypothetical protein
MCRIIFQFKGGVNVQDYATSRLQYSFDDVR